MSSETQPIQPSSIAVNNPFKREDEISVFSDIVELPSLGLFYPHKKDRVKVEYLTASDENILTTEGFIKAGIQFDMLLQRKIKDPDFKVAELLRGDKMAILIWLRKTGYGADYEVNVTDPQNGQTFPYTVDLEQLSNKPMTVLPDENGLFAFELPMTKRVVTFRLLNDNEETELKKLVDAKKRFSGGVEQSITERLKNQIMSINGDTDKAYIARFVDAMPVRDSLSLRIYMDEVQPDLDLEYTFVNPNTGRTFQVEVPFDLRLFYPNIRL